MGADLLLMCIATASPDAVSWSAARHRASSLTRADLPADGAIVPGLDGMADDEASAEDLRSRALASIAEVEEMWEGDRRDAVRLSIGTYELLITGGMSWGDGPSDAYDALSIFVACGLHRAAGFEG